LDAINLKIPTFQGKKDPEAYLKWKNGRLDFQLSKLFGGEAGEIGSN
jgi:hypothetical protein